LKGKAAGGKFTSNSPVTTSNPVSLNLSIPLVENQPPLELRITGARITFQHVTGGLMQGQINGAIKKTDVDSTIIPLAANLLTANVTEALKKDPNSSSATTILNFFDKNDTPCTNPDGTTGMAGDKIISICEVATNSVLKSALAPDVQMFTNGEYKPNKDNTDKDSLSLGIGFTAVGAQITGAEPYPAP
jgi:hypothetical protein